MTSSPRIRVGLLIDSFIQPRWVAKIIQDIRDSSFAEIVLVVRNQSPAGPTGVGALKALGGKRSHLLRKLYVELDRRIFRADPDPFESIDVTPFLNGVPVLHVAPTQTAFSDYFTPEDVGRIRSHALDVAFRFGFRIIRGDALGIARRGIWSYHHGDNLVSRGGPAGFWEVMEGRPVTGSILQVLTSRLDDGVVLYRSWASTIWFSVNRNKANYYWKSSEFAIRTLRALFERGPAAVQPPARGDYQAYSQRLYRAPGNVEMLGLLCRLGGRMVRRGLSTALYREQWFVAVGLSRDLTELPASFHGFRHIVPPRDRYWADPFPVQRDGRHVIFVEELEYRARRGCISAIAIAPDGAWEPAVKVLERPYHLSHPFVFEWEGDLYMIPETAGNRTIELYRCVAFPFEWTFDRVLMSGVRAVDATLERIDGLWWMFVNIGVEGASTNDELHVFIADTPFGPWTPHRRNPVKSDVRSSRPAGSLFCWKGQTYRPAQDSSVSYGHAIAINRIDRLSVDDFDETEVSRIDPTWTRNLLRTHTINRAGALTVIDGMKRVPRWW